MDHVTAMNKLGAGTSVSQVLLRTENESIKEAEAEHSMALLDVDQQVSAQHLKA
jgi:hypothetical protein